MSQQQEAATDRLVNILKTIKIGRRSGLFTVRRGKGATAEEGVILFSNGQVTRANAGRRSGSDALNWLSTWGSCFYSFTPAPTDQAQPPSPAPPFSSSSYKESQGAATSASPAFPSPSQNAPASSTPPPVPSTGPAPMLQSASAPYAIRFAADALRSIDQSGYSRTHRQLFLLVNGNRSIHELARLTGKDLDELFRLLYDLERIEVIQIPGS